MNEFQRISIYHPPGIAIWESILKGVFQFARPDLPWLIATNTGADVERMRKWEPVGAIVQCASEKEAETFNQLGIPIVNVAREASELWFPSVQIDDVEVGRMAAKYFLERGFESLACYRVNNRDFMTARLEGFSEIASQQGVPVSEFQVTRFQSDQLFLAPDSELVSWLNGLPKPTGLLAATDALGLAVLSACRSADIGIPDDISVLGVSNNELLCHLEYPSLSSVSLPGEKLGFEAARKLHAMLSGRNEPCEALRLPPIEIVNRQSTDIYCIEDKTVRAALQFIKENFQKPINVASVVKFVDISRSGLERKFRALLGRSILEELIEQRIKAAKKMLVTTDTTLYTVAERTGFSNARQFATTFRKATGERPSAFRERLSG